MKPPLIATNPYLADPARRRRMLEDTVISSSAIEGVKLDAPRSAKGSAANPRGGFYGPMHEFVRDFQRHVSDRGWRTAMPKILKIEFRDKTRAPDVIQVIDVFAFMAPFDGAYGPIFDVTGAGYLWPLDAIARITLRDETTP